MKRLVDILVLVLVVLLAPASAGAQILVVAPHPDDDIIMGSGAITRALDQGTPVHVVFVTNGDFYGVDAGYQRQGEAIDALAVLGLEEQHAIFLGYPDAYMQAIVHYYNDGTDVLVTDHGVSATYGNRGLGLTDYHTYRFGAPADYHGLNLLADLEDILTNLMPEYILVTSEFDGRDDHIATCDAVMAAANLVRDAIPTYSPTFYKSVVWAPGMEDWPQPMDPSAYMTEAPLGGTPLVWDDRASLDLPPGFESTNIHVNPKAVALLEHRDGAGLLRFVHKDEVFWVETLDESNHAPVVDAGFDQAVVAGDLVELDGVGSRDPDDDPLTYQWVQRAGTAVELVNANSPTPTFTAPVGLLNEEVVVFELVVGDGQYESLADSVRVVVASSLPQPTNIAPLGTATASSANDGSGQSAAKAIDGIVDGYDGNPADPTREWTTQREGSGAWLHLSLPRPYAVSKIALFDRPNYCDQVLAGTVDFSDGSSLTVDELANTGGSSVYTFPSREITGLTFTVDAVSPCTENVGLAEIQVFGFPTEEPEYVLSVPVTPADAGSVAAAPAESAYFSGEVVTLAASANPGYVFSHWSGDASGQQNPTTVTMMADRQITANFVAMDGTLSVTPATAVAASGLAGGPFVPASATYTVENPGGTTIDWLVTTEASWIGFSSSTSGTLAPGGTASVGIVFTSDAAELPPGLHTGVLAFENLTNANGTSWRDVTLTVAPENVALQATATASSEDSSAQSATRAIDGVADGHPGDYTHEWSAANEGVGAWIDLSWSAPYAVSRIELYDRPNDCDRILGGTVTFSDGSTLAIGPLDDAGGPTTFTFPTRVILGLRLSVTAVSTCTQNVGLAEFAVFGVPGELSTFDLTTQAFPAAGGEVVTTPLGPTYYDGAEVGLTAMPSLGYAFSHWSGDAVGSTNPTSLVMNGPRDVTANFVAMPGTLSVTPTAPIEASGPPDGAFTPAQTVYELYNGGATPVEWSASTTQEWLNLYPLGGTLLPGHSALVAVEIAAEAALLEPGTYAGLVLIDNLTNGNGGTSRAVTLTVSTPNIAVLATVTASSDNPATGQTANKVVDGTVDGYPGDYTREWATAGERSGAWVRLSWPSAYLVDRVVLYDRPNDCDQVTGGVVTFSDGSTLTLGALDNLGGATAYDFVSREITDLTVSFTQVSTCTQSVGLSEMQVFGVPFAP